VLLAALSGILLVFSFPKFGHAAVAWVSLAPLLLAIEATGGRAGFRLGFVTGVVSSLGLLYWTALVVDQFGGLGTVVGTLAMLLLCLAFAMGHGLFAAVVALWLRRFGRVALLAAPMAWVAVELVRVRSYFQFPWCLLGYSQHAELSWLQVASLGGVYAVSALVALPAAVIAWTAGEPLRSRRRAALAGLAAVLLSAFGWGSWRLAQPVATSGTLRVALVQPSIAQDEKWRPDLLVEHFLHHLRLSRERASGARLVVWPESSVPWLLEDNPGVLDRLVALAAEGDQYLLFGNDDREGEGQASRIFVGAKLLTPGGELALRHHKLRLVPFGEYVPMAPLFTMGGRFAARVVNAVGTFTPGQELRLGRVDGVPLAALVCYEAIFPELTREFAVRGAGLLVNVTNDAWYGRTSAPWQHFAMARVRAVETGRSLVRAANTGISAVIDPRGRLLAGTGLFEERVLVHDVPIATGTTAYVRGGDLFAWGAFAGTLGLAGLALLLPKRP
jgi:apolipoprotein N-acyltransferase